MTKAVNFRFDSDLIQELQQEAKEQHRTFSNYVVYLLITHQSRGGGVKKATKQKE